MIRMKRCPECRRDYYDDTLIYCLDDGSALLEGPASTDEPRTAILSAFGVPHVEGSSSESPTRPQIHTTDQTAIFPRGTEAEPQDSSGERTHRAAKSHGNFGGRNRLLIVSGIVILLLTLGFFSYRYFRPAGTEQINSIAVLPFQNK